MVFLRMTELGFLVWGGWGSYGLRELRFPLSGGCLGTLELRELEFLTVEGMFGVSGLTELGFLWWGIFGVSCAKGNVLFWSEGTGVSCPGNIWGPLD